ncbi:MAG: MFS transporter [Armatimonadota bacterium]|nr:MFS transporter [Armatimonadota bacterium]
MNQPVSQVTKADDLPAPASAAKERGWLAAVMPVVLIAACAELGISVLNNSALPVYFLHSLKIDTTVYGILAVQFFVAEVLFKSPLGVLADKFGRKPLMLGGALITVFTPMLLISMRYEPLAATAVATLVGFGFLRALDGLGQAALWPSLYAYIGDVVAEKKRGAAMGVLNLVYMVGMAFSFLAGGAVDKFFGPILVHDPGVTFGGQVKHLVRGAGHRLSTLGHSHVPVGSHAVPSVSPAASVPVVVAAPAHSLHAPEYYFPSFYLTSVLFAVAVIAAFALRSKVRRVVDAGGSEQDEKITWAAFLAAVRTVPQFLGIAFVMFAGIGCIMTLVKTFALDEFHITETAFGILVLWPALLIGLIAVPSGYLADKWGTTRCVRLGFLLAAIGMAGIPLLYSLKVGEHGFILAAGVMGIGSVLAFPAWLALLTSLGGEHNRGTVFGAVSTAQGVGAGVGVLLGTTLYGHFSPNKHVSHIAPFVAAAILVALATLLSMIFVREGALRRTAAV